MSKEELFKASALLRGSLINDHAVIEKLIQTYIAHHFCKESTKDEFIEYVVCQHIPFNKTREVLAVILKNNHKELFDKYKKELQYIIDINDERNILAHYMLEERPLTLEHYEKTGEIGFIKVKNGISYEVFTSARIETYKEKIKAVKLMFAQIHDEYRRSVEEQS